MFTFTEHVPHDPREIAEAVGDERQITITKFASPQMLYNLFISVKGITHLSIKEFTALRVREAEFVPIPPPSTYALLEELELHVSFQPRTHKQLGLILELVSKAENLSNLCLIVTQYPTDEFLNTEPYPLKHDPSFNTGLAAHTVSFAPMLQMPTRAERLELEMEADGQKFGQFCLEFLTGQKRLLPPTNPVELAIASLLPSATTQAHLDLQPQAQQQLQPLMVKAQAAKALMEMSKKTPKTYMTPREWVDGMACLLGHPFAPSLQVLELRAVFPSPPTPIRFLSGLGNLEKLRLRFCGIDGPIFESLMPSFSGLFSLRILDLERNQLAGADLAPLVSSMVSLEKLLLQHNDLDGPTTTSLLHELSKGENNTLRFIDLSYNPIRTSGLSFDNLDRWAAPDATLLLPNLFSPEETEQISGCMPDGSILEMVGEYHAPEKEEVAPIGLLDLGKEEQDV